MLKGLEISEVNLSALERTWRLDAEFYSKEHLGVDNLLKANAAVPLTDFANVSDGNHMGVSDEFCSEGVPYFRGGDIKEFFLSFARPEYCVSESTYAKPTMVRSHMKQGDVFVSIVGAIIGQIGMKTDYAPALCSCKLGILRPKDHKTSAYIAAFLSSGVGQSQIWRYRRGSAQTGLILDDFDQLLVPSFSDKFYLKIKDLVSAALQARQGAVEAIKNAEEMLLAELGFAGWSPTDDAVSVKSYSDFVSAGRFDAEYFQPKYDELFALLNKCKTRPLGGKDGLVDIQRSIEPGSDAYSDKGVPFVRIADFTEMGISSPEIHIPPEICADSPRPKKDTILLSKDGSVGIAYKVEDDLDVVTSSGILHLTVKDTAVLPDYLTLVLNSKIVRLQAERDAGGSIIQHWKQTEIERVKIPLLPLPRQRAIATKVQSSFALRAESKRLLDLAKKVVEIAIEQGEENAMADYEMD